MKKRILLVLSAFFIVFEIIGIVLNYREVGSFGINYYTEDSNILALIATIIYLGYLIKGKIPKTVSALKFISTVALAVTFLVVIFVLGPAANYDYKNLLFSNAMLFHHTLCPIIAIISTIFLEQHKVNTLKKVLIGSSTTLIYGIIMIILNLLKLTNGPYFFLNIYENGILTSIIWFVVIIGGSIGISAGLGKLNQLTGSKV